MSENNQKIKSIKLIKEFPFWETLECIYLKTTVLGDTGNKQWFVDLNEISEKDIKKIKNCPEFFEIEYESQKPKLLKRSDGSLITEPEEGEEIVVIDLDFSLIEIIYKDDLLNKSLIKQKRVFLKEDKHLAEKKAKNFPKQIEILQELVEILENLIK